MVRFFLARKRVSAKNAVATYQRVLELHLSLKSKFKTSKVIADLHHNCQEEEILYIKIGACGGAGTKKN